MFYPPPLVFKTQKTSLRNSERGYHQHTEASPTGTYTRFMPTVPAYGTHWQTTQNSSCTARTVPLSLYLRVASHQRKVLFSYYHHIPGGRKKQGLKNYLVLRLVWALRKVNTRDIITTDNPGPEKSMNPAAVKACRVENNKGGHTLWKTVWLSSAASSAILIPWQR
jgi:hypothetical protein